MADKFQRLKVHIFMRKQVETAHGQENRKAPSYQNTFPKAFKDINNQKNRKADSFHYHLHYYH